MNPPILATDPLVGRYTLEIDAQARSGLRCESVPDYATRRTYTADIHNLGDHHVVKLYGATFLADSPSAGYGCLGVGFPMVGYEACHQFLLAGDASSLVVTMTPPDDWRDNEIWEALPDGHLLAITGGATGQVRDGRIEASGTGHLWYGDGLPASTVYACRSEDFRLTFTPLPR